MFDYIPTFLGNLPSADIMPTCHAFHVTDFRTVYLQSSIYHSNAGIRSILAIFSPANQLTWVCELS